MHENTAPNPGFYLVACLCALALGGCSGPNDPLELVTPDCGSVEADASDACTGGPDAEVTDQGEARDDAAEGEVQGDAAGGEVPAPCPADPEALLPDWIDGTDCAQEAQVQVHQVDADTYVLRQSLCTNFEGPFMYLLFGDDRVLLEDTGAGGIPIAEVVYGVIADWLGARGQLDIEFLVLNSHGHGDHVAGNSQFQGMPHTTVVGASQAAVAAYFGITDWPNGGATIDLGGRTVELIPIPGHHSSHVALYDSRLRWLLTGDTLYPGRLYISQFPDYLQSIERLVNFTETRDLCAVMGTHIEMTETPGGDFSYGVTSHPAERGLALGRAHLIELRDAVVAMDGAPVYQVHDDFIIYPL